MGCYSHLSDDEREQESKSGLKTRVGRPMREGKPPPTYPKTVHKTAAGNFRYP